MDRSIPAGIFYLIEGFKISPYSILKSVKVLIFILIVFGDAGEVKRKVFFLKGLFSLIQYLIDFFFFRNLAGEKGKNGKQKAEEISSHFNFSNSPPG
jgi:hypothetical protein